MQCSMDKPSKNEPLVKEAEHNDTDSNVSSALMSSKAKKCRAHYWCRADWPSENIFVLRNDTIMSLDDLSVWTLVTQSKEVSSTSMSEELCTSLPRMSFLS